MKIEKLIDPAKNPEGAKAQTAQGYVSLMHGPWVVTGTDDIAEAQAFVQELLQNIPATLTS